MAAMIDPPLAAPESPPAPPALTRADAATLAVAALVMLLILELHLLSALIAGLLIYEVVQSLGRRLKVAAIGHESAKLLAVVLLAMVVISLLTLAIIGIVAALRHGSDSLPALMTKLAEAIETSRGRLPGWLVDSLPNDAGELRTGLVELLRGHASTLQGFGKSFGRSLAHVLIGMIVGAMLALRKAVPETEHGPLAAVIAERAERLANSFRRVVFAQAWIATLNAVFTWLYIGVALPLFGVQLPQIKTLLIITWICGLLPIIGNLISNTVIVAVSLGYSLPVAIASLVFLVVIHKLGYFLNARIIGSQIRASAWELLIAMLAMETAFGISGIIAAPIFYAYFKDELARLRLI